MDGTVTATEFLKFVENDLVAKLNPFDGHSLHNVVVLDNASIHHVAEVVQAIESTVALLLFLPPYSPNLNPIEETFSKLKYYLRQNDPAIQVADDDDLPQFILSGFATMTVEDCYGWIKHAGYVQ